MKLLLDTHIWIWSVGRPDRLTSRVRRALANASNELWLSAVSPWEVIVLADDRHLEFDGGVEQWIAKARTALPLRDAPLTHEMALATRGVSRSLRDPADRWLIATASVLGLTLVTADKKIIEFSDGPLLVNK